MPIPNALPASAGAEWAPGVEQLSTTPMFSPEAMTATKINGITQSIGGMAIEAAPVLIGIGIVVWGLRKVYREIVGNLID